MTDRDAAVRRARRALDPLLPSDVDPVEEHPGYEVLEAYVDGRLDAAGRATVERLAAQSSIVADDLADLAELRDAMRHETAPLTVRTGWWTASRSATVAGLAAVLVMAVWLGNRPAPDAGREARPAIAVVPTSRLTDGERQSVAARIANGTLSLPAAIVALGGKEGTLLGSTDTPSPFGLVGPVGTAVLSTRPTFEWSGGGGERYTIAVFDDRYTEVAQGTVTGTSWTPAIDLARGTAYRWQVTAHRAAGDVTAPAPPQPEARFLVLDLSTAALVRDQRARLADEPLALGILLADAGLRTEARAELSRALSTPATATAAKTFLNSLPAR